MAHAKNKGKQNLTISLDRETMRKAKILAAKHSTSISNLVKGQIEILVAKEDAYKKAMQDALALLEQGFDLGGEIRASRTTCMSRVAYPIPLRNFRWGCGKYF